MESLVLSFSQVRGSSKPVGEDEFDTRLIPAAHPFLSVSDLNTEAKHVCITLVR
jgi:hypothetical protein